MLVYEQCIRRSIHNPNTHTCAPCFRNEQSNSNLCVDVCYSHSILSERVRSCITASPLSLNNFFFVRSFFSLLHGLTQTDTSYHRCGNYNNLTKSIFSIVAHRSSIKSSIFMATCWPEVNFIFRIIDVAISLHIISCLWFVRLLIHSLLLLRIIL